jgi:hypothetical protein
MAPEAPLVLDHHLHGPWPRLLLHELRSARWMRSERRRALAEMRLPVELELPAGEDAS